MRREEIDLARGFTVFIMAPVHAVLIYSTTGVHHSWLGYVLAFLAEGPGAQLFMMVMGISFALSRKKKFETILIKSFKLLLLAYLLNFLKFIVPLAVGIIPRQLLTDNGISTGNKAYTELFLLGDILYLAAISLVVLACIQLPRYCWLWPVLLAGIVIFVSPFLWGIGSGNPLINYLYNLLWTNGSNVYFPVFPWLAYPLIGLSLGHYIIRNPEPYKNIGVAGLALLIIGGFLCYVKPSYNSGSFYTPGPGAVIYHVGFVMLWLYGCKLAVLYVSPNRFFRLLSWLSKCITTVYFVQWILIFWLLDVFGYRKLDLTRSLECIIVITPAVFFITFLIEKYLTSQKKIYAASNL